MRDRYAAMRPGRKFKAKPRKQASLKIRLPDGRELEASGDEAVMSLLRRLAAE